MSDGHRGRCTDVLEQHGQVDEESAEETPEE